MRKVKLDAKSGKASDAFFENENPFENGALNLAGGANVSELEKETSSANTHQSFFNFLKQIFLFLPGTFLLFFMSFGLGIIFMEIFVYGRTVDKLPDDYPFQFALMGFIVLLGALMTWLGLGDIKNKKHLAIPASLIVTGAIIGAVVKAAAGISVLADRMLDDFDYLIYLLPFALMVPILAKGIVDRKTGDSPES